MPEIWISRCKNNPENAQNLPKELSSDFDYMLSLIKTVPRALTYCGELLRDNEFLLKLLANDVNIADALTLSHRINKEFMLKAIKINLKMKELVHPKLLNDTEFIKEMAKITSNKI